MRIKGVAFLARADSVIRRQGAPTWEAFLREYQQQAPFFRQAITPVTQIPTEDFLAFNEALVRRFHPGEARPYWDFGEASARWALTQGQLKGLFQPGELKRFMLFTPGIYKSYFDGGELQATAEGPARVLITITGVPQHSYFEETLLGFATGGLKHLGAAHPEPEVLQTFARGDAEVKARFRLD